MSAGRNSDYRIGNAGTYFRKQTALRRRDTSDNCCCSRRLNRYIGVASLSRQRKRAAISTACFENDRVAWYGAVDGRLQITSVRNDESGCKTGWSRDEQDEQGREELICSGR